jgi:hypothetical protein
VDERLAEEWTASDEAGSLFRQAISGGVLDRDGNRMTSIPVGEEPGESPNQFEILIGDPALGEEAKIFVTVDEITEEAAESLSDLDRPLPTSLPAGPPRTDEEGVAWIAALHQSRTGALKHAHPEAPLSTISWSNDPELCTFVLRSDDGAPYAVTLFFQSPETE